MNTSATNSPDYTEKLLPSVNTYIAIAIVWPTIWLTLYPWTHDMGIWIGALTAGVMCALAILNAPRIVVTKDALTVGKAVIPRSELGNAEVLTGEEARRARGPELHPGAFVLFRGTTQKLVRVAVVSKLDPTPYWLISSRRPAQLAEALKN